MFGHRCLLPVLSVARRVRYRDAVASRGRLSTTTRDSRARAFVYPARVRVLRGSLFRRRVAPLAATAGGGEITAVLEPAAAGTPVETTAAPEHVVAGVVLAAHNLTVRAGRRRILHAVSLVCRPGELMGIVGASGAGKST